MFFKRKKAEEISAGVMPKHIGIIMDGNGRWAKKRGMPRNVGHRAGAETLKKIVTYCDKIGIKTVTVYAFSTENWKRPKEEVDSLMSLLKEYLSNAERDLGGKNAVIRVIGDRTALSEDIQQRILETEEFTKDRTGVVLNLALNYGGRDEIVHAVNELLREGKTEITEHDISEKLYEPEIADVDLIIRPSGEYRLSNFLLWESAYTEFWFDNVLWPDFTEKHLDRAIADFQKRNRRFGGV